MEQYGYTPEYLTRDGEPWFPVMGEIHYSRYPKKYWKEAVEKMKAGGLDLISAYVFWLHHEEVRGEYDFTGDRDLRAFVKTVKECNAKMILRIGPWCHGEARNGGFPDWLMQEDCKLRTNDEKYLALVEEYYFKVFEQVEGYLHKDGGPIIGVQIENEYGHVGGLTGEEGEEHMRTLRALAIKAGFDVPIYTATGWGGAVTGGCIPVMGGYCEAPWDQRLTEIEPSGNYVFTKERNDHNIGSDHGFGEGITYDMDKFPFLTAELGGGLQVTKHRRPVAHSKDIGAMTLTKLGCGVNLLGYYMYHGGTNPDGKLSTLQESRETGYPNDLPELSYNFNAPIREYGNISETFKEIKLISMFIKDFGSEFCTMKTYLPESNPTSQNDFTSIRTSVRRNGDTGYLFMNNYQRRYQMAEHKDAVLEAQMETKKVSFPAMKIKDKDFFFFPIGMKLGNAVLEQATASPLCVLDNETKTYVFYTDNEPNYVVNGSLDGVELLTLTREDAKNAYKVTSSRGAGEMLVISKGCVIEDGATYKVFDATGDEIKIYPVPKKKELYPVISGYQVKGEENGFLVYENVMEKGSATVAYVEKDERDGWKTYQVTMSYEGDMDDCFLNILYGGDEAELYLDGKKRADWFYDGKGWYLGLKKFDFPKSFEIKVQELKEGTPCFLEVWPEMKDGRACEIYAIETVVENVRAMTV